MTLHLLFFMVKVFCLMAQAAYFLCAASISFGKAWACRGALCAALLLSTVGDYSASFSFAGRLASISAATLPG